MEGLEQPTYDGVNSARTILRRPTVDSLCHSCYRIASSLIPSTSAAMTGTRRVCDLTMASRDPTCLLCTFLLDIATDAAALARLPGAPKFGMYALHKASFSEMFFDAEDQRRFVIDVQPAVFFISPLYAFGAKARDWALKYNSCFMVPGRGSQEDVAPYARQLKMKADLAVVREWVCYCEERHTHHDCNPEGLLSLNGFHVIDCERRSVIVCPPGTSYVTLSYVWGLEPVLDFDDGSTILPETLPMLIEDAMQVTLNLGYQFLWVDRYCIPQENGVVKHQLIRNMNRIYSESSLTIIASASERPSDGLIGVSASRTELPHSLWMDDLHLSQLTTNLANEIESSRWNTRGWTYQEGFLSSKRLLFTKGQCYFQCGEMWCTEGLSVTLSTFATLIRPDCTKLARVFPWGSHRSTSMLLSADCGPDRIRRYKDYFVDRVREYMRRELTHDSDAFNAFAGVLSYLECYAQEFLVGNIYGLPIWSRTSPCPGQEDARGILLRGLAWSIPFLQDDRGPITLSATALVERREEIPSWTWCGWRHRDTSSSGIVWMDLHRGSEPDLNPCTDIIIEYDGDEIISWASDGEPRELLARGQVRGNARSLRICGWLSRLIIPSACWNDGPETCQCGPYRLKRKAARYLSIAAQRQGLPIKEQGYVLKIWFFAPLEFSVVQNKCRAMVMVFVARDDDNVYERLETLCEVTMEYFVRRPSLDELACRFQWEWAAFRIE